jgi:hypothetical protein
MRTMKKILIAAALFAASASIQAKELNEVWVNAGFMTAHYDRDADLSGENFGLGAEYRWSPQWSAVAGRFRNSDRARSNYLGVTYQPWEIGGVKLGAVVAAFNGYPFMRNGAWFPAVIPVASLEGDRLGLNVGFIPSYKNRLYGGISFQLKLKVN